MSSEVLLTTSVARVGTSESGHDFELLQLSPLESAAHSRLSEPSFEELDAVLSGEKSHDGGDHAEADTQHRIEHFEPLFRLCAWFGLHAAATSPPTTWQKAHGIVIVFLIGVCGIRIAVSAAYNVNVTLDTFLSVFFLGSIPAFVLKLSIFWSRPKLHRSFSLLLDPAHDALMHSTRIDFTKRARSISNHWQFCFYSIMIIFVGIVNPIYVYSENWSQVVEFFGATGIYAEIFYDIFIFPYATMCIICQYSFEQFVCDSHVVALRRLEALFVSSRLAQSLEPDILGMITRSGTGHL